MGTIFNSPHTTARRRALRNAPTSAEAYLWKFLRRRNIAGCKFRRQHGIDSYVVDFYAPEVRLAIELDGEVHDKPEQASFDRFRQNNIERHGVRILRFRNEELFEQTDRVLNRIEKEVVALRTHHNVPPSVHVEKIAPPPTGK